MTRHRPLLRALQVLLRTPDTTTPRSGVHIRDVLDLKRTMAIVLLALLPVIAFAFYRYGFVRMMPLFAVSYGVGLGIEWLFALVRRHHINEGYLVTGALIPLIVPVTIPLWQLAVAVAFAVVFAKEVFGGTGYNIFNPALVCRAFLFFAYPAQMTGTVWVPPPAAAYDYDAKPAPALYGIAAVSGATSSRQSMAPPPTNADAVSAATPLAVADSAPYGRTRAALTQAGYTTRALLVGNVPGTPGELSKLAILFGAAVLLLAGIASARIMIGGVAGVLITAAACNALATEPVGLFALSPLHHLLLGGLLFGLVFMATDPVTSPETSAGKWMFGFSCGALTVLIRLYSPAYVEGTMLAILLMNAFAPAIDRAVLALVVQKRRLRRGAAR